MRNTRLKLRAASILLVLFVCITAVCPVSVPAAAVTQTQAKTSGGVSVKNGLKKESGAFYFYKNGVRVKNAFQKVKRNGKTVTYYFGSDGKRVYGKKTIGKYTYYFDRKSGVMAAKKFVEDKNKTYYLEKNGHMVKNKTKKIGSSRYKFAKSGTMTTKRYIVTCNYHYDNKVNTLGKYSTLKNAKQKISRQSSLTRGQWYIYDCVTKKVVWPDLSTTQKKVKKAISWLKAVARDSRHGYSCEGENTNTNLKTHWGRWGARGDYSCSTLAATAYELTGLTSLRKVAGEKKLKMTALRRTYTGYNSTTTGRSCLKSKHFKDVTSKLRKYGRSGLKAGDILVGAGGRHVGVYVGDGRIVEATINEVGREYAGYGPGQVTPGDQRGSEIRIHPYDGRWQQAYRPK